MPVLEVHDPLLRCVHCNVFAYQETVKQLAKRRPYRLEESEPMDVQVRPFLDRLGARLARALSDLVWQLSARSRARTAD